MPRITASDVKKLRQMSGAGMMDCKKALTETEGNLEAAVDYLRKKGLSAASRKAGRVAAEGIVVAKSESNTGIVIEVNAETDFTSRNEKFLLFVNRIADIISHENPADLKALTALPFDGEQNVEQALSQLIATIGENMSIRRFARVHVSGGIVASYVHGAGKIGVLIGIEADDTDAIRKLAKHIAMHVAAANPQHISRGDVPAEKIERERAVLSERAAASGKPEGIIEKIVNGQLNKFYQETCLTDQAFVMDTDHTVAKVLAEAQCDARIVAMERFQLGEGIEKAKEDFAAEVAAQVNG